MLSLPESTWVHAELSKTRDSHCRGRTKIKQRINYALILEINVRMIMVPTACLHACFQTVHHVGWGMIEENEKHIKQASHAYVIMPILNVKYISWS